MRKSVLMCNHEKQRSPLAERTTGYGSMTCHSGKTRWKGFTFSFFSSPFTYTVSMNQAGGGAAALLAVSEGFIASEEQTDWRTSSSSIRCTECAVQIHPEYTTQTEGMSS